MLRQKAAAHTRQYQSKHHHEHHYSGPFFEGPLNTSAGALNVGVHLYTEGVFDCRVGMLKDKTVSFKRDPKQMCLTFFCYEYTHTLINEQATGEPYIVNCRLICNSTML